MLLTLALILLSTAALFATRIPRPQAVPVRVRHRR